MSNKIKILIFNISYTHYFVYNKFRVQHYTHNQRHFQDSKQRKKQEKENHRIQT